MRAAALSVWIFINLLCFGMCGYLYLIWSQYWMYIEKQRFFNKPTGNPLKVNSGTSYQETYNSNNYLQNSLTNRSLNVESRKSRRAAVGTLWSNSKLLQLSKSSSAHPSNNIVRKHGSPRFPNVHKPILEFDSDKYLCNDYTTVECETLTREFKESLLKEFHRVLMGEGNVFKSGLEVHNTYNVHYAGSDRRERSGAEVLCALSRVAVRTVTSEDEPFRSRGFQIRDGALQRGRRYNTCAVVTSAGAMLGSHLGEFIGFWKVIGVRPAAALYKKYTDDMTIDTHDMVLRFNNAPVENFTDDVGSKTTFRILNSQVVSKPEYRFLQDKLYRNISIIVWDPANYSSTLDEWFHHPDFPLFPVYKELLEQRKDADVHLLRPEVLWELWAVLQDSTPYRLRRNPPSSGFIGLWFALHRCNRVRMFEYVPSARASRRCHYHATHDDVGCTFGAWHPLAQEKALAERMRHNSDLDVFQRGFIDVPGFTNVDCG